MPIIQDHIGERYTTHNKRFTIGSEVITHNFYSDKGDHKFSGGNVMIAYSITGSTRPYRTEGSIFGFVPVKKSVFKGGLGEIEAVRYCFYTQFK